MPASEQAPPFQKRPGSKPGRFFRLKIIYIENVHTFSNYILEWLLFNLAALQASN